jgi:hypothetical protein
MYKDKLNLEPHIRIGKLYGAQRFGRGGSENVPAPDMNRFSGFGVFQEEQRKCLS